jgi:DNA-binding SARP family transcriptional activator/tetratricopeptide (TPR) repeat protein
MTGGGTSPRAWRVRVLGPLVVEATETIGDRKSRTLLTVLAAEAGRPVGVDTLADVLWPEALPASPSDQISVLVSRLRRVLGASSLRRGASGYALHVGWIDVVELEHLVDAAAQHLADGAPAAALDIARAALELERGPLAAGEEAAWFEPRRRMAERMILHARSIVADAALACGELGTATEAAQRLLDADPYDEAAAATLMRAQVAAGRPSTALGTYATVRRRLANDLGTNPSAALQQLHRDVLAAEDRSGVDAEPAGVRRLAGRDRELAQLRSALDAVDDASGATTVVVTGEAGIGKTALLSTFVASARVQGALVLHGRCDPLGRDLPLQPIIDALAPHVPASPAELAALVGSAAVAELFAGGGAVPTGRVGTPVVGARTDLHAGLVELIAALAGDRSTVVAVDDVHLADAATKAVLATIARSDLRALVIVARRPTGAVDWPVAAELALGPLDADAAAQIVGDERATELHRRAAGSPLLLLHLMSGAETVSESSVARAEALGIERADVLKAAAVIGPRLDVDLLAAVVQRPAADVLDVLDAGCAADLVTEIDGAIAFRHELVREALAASVSAPRRTLLHRSAADALLRRPSADPVEVAWHAVQGGVPEQAAGALRRAAMIAYHRFELDEAVALLDRAVALLDDADTRLARATVHLARRRLDLARHDADRALALRPDAASLELVGWIAYHRRDHELARACADEGAARAAAPELRASLLVLGGRHRHTRGELREAQANLEEAVRLGSDVTRALASVWLASLRAHTGRPAEAIALAARGSIDVARAEYPFAVPHAYVARAIALGHAGRIAEALAALDDMDAEVAREGVPGRRFAGIAANLRGWLLRNLGRTDEADLLNQRAAQLPADLEHAEVHYAAHLDLIEGRLLVDDHIGARALVDRMAAIERWEGSMAWRHRDRYRLQRARLAIAEGDAIAGERLARDVQHGATARGSRRYAVFAGLAAEQAAVAAGADRTERIDRIGALLDQLPGIAEPERWWLTARAAAATRHQPWWAAAEEHVDALAAAAGGDGDRLRPFADELFRRWR